MNQNKSFFKLIGLMTFVMVCYFGYYIITGVPVVYGTDLRPQWFEFYTEFQNLMTNFFENHILPFYSWSSFLGTNFYCSKSYYLMGDIFNYIGLLFPTQFFNTALILEIMKYYVAGISMYFFLKSFRFKDTTLILGSLSYAFSGWAIFFSGQMSFLSFYAWMPLYFLGIEIYFKNKSGLCFTIISGLLLLTNFYFFFTISAFTPVYFIYRYYILSHKLKGFFLSALRLVVYYLVAVLLTGVLTLPTIMYMLQNDRVGTFASGVFFENVKVYLHELITTLIPNYLYIYRVNVFEIPKHVFREICGYSGSIVILLVPQFIKNKDEYFKKATTVVYVLFIIICVFPVCCAALHGFADPSFRWMLFLIFFNILVFAQVMEEGVDENLLRKTVIIISFLLLTIIPITCLLTGQTLSDFLCQYLIFAIFVVVYWLDTILVFKKKESFLIMLLTIELTVSGTWLYLNQYNEAKENGFNFINRATHTLGSYGNELNDYLNYIDDKNYSSYYRVYIPHESLYWSYSHNMSVFYHLNGVMTYDSTYAPSLNDLKTYVPEVMDFDSGWIFNIKESNVLQFLSVKYAVVTDEAELPEGINWKLIRDDYNFVLLVYENEDYIPLGRTVSKVKLLGDFNSSSDLLDTVLCKDENINVISSYVSEKEAYLENIQYFGNQLYGDITTETDGFMVIALPYDSGWTIKVNEEVVDTYKVNCGFIGIKINEGYNSVMMTFTPSGFKNGVLLTLAGIFLFIGLIIFEKKTI